MPPPAPPKFINSFCKRSIKPKFFKFSRAIIMGCFYQILHLMIFLFMSTHILIIAADSSSLDPVDYFKKFVKVGSDDDYEKNQIEKVSGLEDDEKGETLIVQKFRALFGFGAESPRSNDEDESFSPSPSPAPSAEEAESPAPAPLPPIARPRSPAHRPHLLPEPQKVKNDGNKGILKKILVSVFVSAGAAVVVSALVLVCFSSKFGKHRSKVLFYKRRGKSKYNGSQRSTTKLNLNPGLDFLYLESLEKDLEQQATVVKQNPETVTALPKEEVETRTESPRSSSSSSTKEITSVHEDEVDSAKNEFDGGGDESVSSVDKAAAVVAADECHSSDDESFHSFADSNSHTLLSNASAGSLSEAKANSSSNFDDKNSETQQAARDHTSDLISTSMARCDALSVSASSVCSKQGIPPPPPPPPPPLPLAMPPSKRLPPSFASARPTRITSRPSTSLTKQNDLPFSPGRSPKASQVRKSIPPPPSPPPFPKGNSSDTKGPPPPSLLPNYTPLGKDGAPLPKLKPLHWDKVRAAPDRGMVWDKIRSSSFELDEEMIESLFGYNIQNAMRNEEAKSKTPSPSKHVLEPKRLQNITILFKALNSTAEQVCEALIRGDGLCLQQLEALVKMVPTKEEEAKLAEHKGSINELGSTEKFVKKLLSIPFAFSRVEAMLYKETFEDEVVHLRNSFSMLEEACKELRSSRLFLKLLEAVLKTGNRMNVGTIRGGARAFKLDALLKLADVKGTDGKTTLLHFVVQEIIRSEGVRVSDSIMGKISQKSKTNNNEEKEEYYRRMGLDLVSGLSTELYNVKKTATIDVDVLANSVSNLSSGMAKLHDLIHNELSSNGMDINFVKTMKNFLNYTERNVKELKEDEDRVMLNVREITEYFHGDVSKEEANPLRIFVIVRDFLGMLDHVCKELRSFKVHSPSPLAPFR